MIARMRLALALALLVPSSARADEPAPVMVNVVGAGCPDRERVEEALRVRGLVVVDRDAPFRVDVAIEQAGLQLVVRDPERAAILERTVASEECGALADTVALLVERRLAGVEWQAPLAPAAPSPAPPPPASAPAVRVARPVSPAPARPWALDLLAGGAYSTTFRQGAGGAGPSLDVRLRAPSPYGVRLSAAWFFQPDLPVFSGSMEITRVPVTLAASRLIRGPGLELDLEAAMRFEIVSATTRGIAEPATATRVAIRAGLAAALGFQIVPHVWLLAHGGAYALLSGYDFVVHSVADPAEKTEIASQVASLEAGLALGWRFGP